MCTPTSPSQSACPSPKMEIQKVKVRGLELLQFSEIPCATDWPRTCLIDWVWWKLARAHNRRSSYNKKNVCTEQIWVHTLPLRSLTKIIFLDHAGLSAMLLARVMWCIVGGNLNSRANSGGTHRMSKAESKYCGPRAQASSTVHLPWLASLHLRICLHTTISISRFRYAYVCSTSLPTSVCCLQRCGHGANHRNSKMHKSFSWESLY